MEHLDHQDWKQIIIHSKQKNINSDNTKKTKVIKNKNGEKNKIDNKLDKKVEDGDMKHKIVSLKLRQEIQKFTKSNSKRFSYKSKSTNTRNK